MNHEDYSDRYLRDILLDVRSIAMVGASTTWSRPSYFVMKYLIQKGYRVIPVNPRSAGQELLGETVCSGLDTLPEQVDMVDMFRPAGEAIELVRQAIRLEAKVFWMQLELRNEEAASMAEEQGMKVVMNRCPKIEYSRLFGELVRQKAGNTQSSDNGSSPPSCLALRPWKQPPHSAVRAASKKLLLQAGSPAGPVQWLPRPGGTYPPCPPVPEGCRVRNKRFLPKAPDPQTSGSPELPDTLFVSNTSSQNNSDDSRSYWHRPWQCCAHQEGCHANNGLNNPRGS